MTHMRARLAANGDVTAYYYFCTRSCWLGSFDLDRIGPPTVGQPVGEGVTTGGATPGAASGEESEVHCAECGGLIASPYRPRALLVGGLRAPMGANGEAEPFNFMEPELEQARAEHHIGAWRYEGGTIDDPIDFRLDCWWDGRTDGPRAVIGYMLRANNEVIFEAEDYKPGPSVEPDSDVAAGHLLGFLSCRPGDTDAEYFANYTLKQLAFAEKHGEELSIWSQTLEGEDE